MSKIPIEDQIAAVESVRAEISLPPEVDQKIQAALTTLKWLKANPELLKVLHQINKAFPGSAMDVKEHFPEV